MNLFTSTQGLASSRLEDHLTEFIAAALLLDEGFRTSFAAILLAEHAKAKGWETPRIVGVETQVSYPGTGCCPDMRLTLADGKVILCEHKIEAPETEGNESKEDGQIGRYLKLPSDGVAYIRASWKPPKGAVLDNPLYVKPANREHFQWRDFHGALKGSLFLDWMRAGFDRMGFNPPLPEVGDLCDPDTEMQERNRRNFAKLWSLTKSEALRMGWKPEAGSIVQLYLFNATCALASMVWVLPDSAERFLLRITPKPGLSDRVEDLANRTVESLGLSALVAQRQITRKGAKVPVVDVETSLHEVLGAAKGTDEMERSLWRVVGGFLAMLDRESPEPAG